MSKTPLVSIASAAFNHGKYVEECILSIINQTYENWEWIIVDDNSTDNTAEIIKKYAKQDKRIKLVQSKFNQGVSASFNQAAKEGKGKYISILATDDAYEPSKLEIQVAYMEKHPECGAVFSHISIIDENSIPYEHEISKEVNVPNYSREEMLRRFWFDGNYLASPTEMLRRDVFKAMDYYQLGLILTADYDSHIKVLFNHDIHVVQKPLVKYRFRRDESNTSARNVVNRFRSSNELSLLLNTFLEMKDVELFKKAFGKDVNKYGEPTKETIPYFFARLAVDTMYQDWGYQTMCKIINSEDMYKKLNKLYGFTFKDFMKAATDGAQKLKKDLAKLQRRKKRLKVFMLALGLSFLANIALLAYLLLD